MRGLEQLRAGEGAGLVHAGDVLRGGGGTAGSLYIHVPFCFHKCHYCDFYSIVDMQDRQGPFAERLKRELGALAGYAARPLRTIFVGGGTPSLMRADLWRGVLGVLASEFDLSEMGAGAGEFTVECNPETVTEELLGVLREGGVTRISMGAQSFSARHLATLDRKHDPENVEKALVLARAAGISRRSVDLIFGVPGQTVEEWCADLKRATALGTEHLSCYSLTYEPGTAMTARLMRGEFSPCDEGLEVEMHEATLETLRGHGFERYEVSNYARPGAECRHNMAYWRQEEWLAAGPSASGHFAGRRWKNVARLDDYLKGDFEGFAAIVEYEGPDARRALSERIMTGLRLKEGLDRSFVLREGEKVLPGAEKRMLRVLARHDAAGYLVREGERLALTDSGFLFADRIAGELMRCLLPL